MSIWVERPPDSDGRSRSRTFGEADHWTVGQGGNLEVRGGSELLAEIVAGDWTIAEVVK